LLMDAGEGTQIMFNKAGLSLAKLNVVLITHLHGDHVFGLPGIIQTRSMMGVKKELIVIGPGGIKEFISRVNELTRFKPGYRLNIIEAPIELDLGYVTIKTFKTEHIVPSFGYVVNIHSRERNVKVVYTGDTSPAYNLNELGQDIDVLIHDSTFHYELSEEAHKYGHSTSRDAALIANSVNAKVLILHHISNRYLRNEELLLDDARRFFRRVYIGKPLLTFIL